MPFDKLRTGLSGFNRGKPALAACTSAAARTAFRPRFEKEGLGKIFFNTNKKKNTL
jgi:hypothetical protein